MHFRDLQGDAQGLAGGLDRYFCIVRVESSEGSDTAYSLLSQAYSGMHILAEGRPRGALRTEAHPQQAVRYRSRWAGRFWDRAE